MHENDEMYLSAELLPAKISLAHTNTGISSIG